MGRTSPYKKAPRACRGCETFEPGKIQVGVLVPGSCRPREAGLHYAGFSNSLPSSCGSKWSGTSRAWQGAVSSFVVVSRSIILRVTGFSSLRIDSFLAYAVAENALPILRSFAQFGVAPRPLFPFAEELVGNVERGEDR